MQSLGTIIAEFSIHFISLHHIFKRLHVFQYFPDSSSFTTMTTVLPIRPPPAPAGDVFAPRRNSNGYRAIVTIGFIFCGSVVLFFARNFSANAANCKAVSRLPVLWRAPARTVSDKIKIDKALQSYQSYACFERRNRFVWSIPQSASNKCVQILQRYGPAGPLVPLPEKVSPLEMTGNELEQHGLSNMTERCGNIFHGLCDFLMIKIY